jgi:hypothetical protein
VVDTCLAPVDQRSKENEKETVNTCTPEGICMFNDEMKRGKHTHVRKIITHGHHLKSTSSHAQHSGYLRSVRLRSELYGNARRIYPQNHRRKRSILLQSQCVPRGRLRLLNWITGFHATTIHDLESITSVFIVSFTFSY